MKIPATAKNLDEFFEYWMGRELFWLAREKLPPPYQESLPPSKVATAAAVKFTGA